MTQIMIVGEAWGREEEEVRKPFIGPSGELLRAKLYAAGINPGECYLTNVFNLRPKPTNDVLNLCGPKADGIPGLPALAMGKYVKAEYLPEFQRLYDEVERVNPNVILALGNTAVLALTKAKHPISTFRGTLFESLAESGGRRVKTIATFHPTAVLRDWTLNLIVAVDLLKLKKHAASPTFTRPKRELWIAPSIADISLFIGKVLGPQWHRPCGVDIETAAGTITEIGFGFPEVGINIPFYLRGKGGPSYWQTHEEERTAWGLVRHILENLKRPIFQNGLYDINYLWRTMGLQVPNAGEDTMLLHHSLHPGLKKGLGFLGSLYTDEPSWKLMRRMSTLKKEE